MNYTIQNNTGKDVTTLNGMVDAYFPYAQKNMGFDEPVTIIFESDLENAKNPLGKTAYYDPSNYTVVLYTDGRHPKDIMRSLSHELVHHKQNCNGELNGLTGEQGYAQTEHGSYIEEEAYRLGNKYFRNWEDSLKKQNNETNYSRREESMQKIKEMFTENFKKLTKENKNMKFTREDIRKVVEKTVKDIITERAETRLASTEAVSEGNDVKRPLNEDDGISMSIDGIWSPNHYCIHHGVVNHNGKTKMAEAVSHNYNEKLGRVTHYDMKLEDGTILENVASEDIQVTNASLAEGHGHPMKRDDDKKKPDFPDLDDDGDKDESMEDALEDKEEKEKGLKEEEETEEPLKEGYDNSLFKKLLKESTRRKR